jgi:hypothetical protein
MSSNINPNNIDNTYPVAGQQNSSQGFRDNFTNIKNNFLFAASEISDLQGKAIVSSALNGQTLNNNMAGGLLTAPQLNAWTESFLDLGSISVTATVDFTKASVQRITTAAPISIALVNWPATTGQTGIGYGTVRVWINVTNPSHTVTLPATVSNTVGDIAGYNSINQTITFDQIGIYVFEFSSIDGGTTYLIQDVTRNRSSFRDPDIYFNPTATISPTLFVGYGERYAGATALNVALAYDEGLNTISALGTYNSSAIGNLSLANIVNATIDTGSIGGYTITAARGNLAQANLQPVQSNDYLGYINGVALTGTGSGSNTFQQTASIVFYATGPNAYAGLGGNIALYTAVPNDSGSQAVLQAMGIENDQSVNHYGNVTVAGRFTTSGSQVDSGTYLTTFVTTPGVYNQFVANAYVSTVVIDSSASANIPLANITLPSNPVNGQKIKIAAVAPIVNANVYVPGSIPSVPQVKWVASNKFSSGNTSVLLTYLSAGGAWYVS